MEASDDAEEQFFKPPVIDFTEVDALEQGYTDALRARDEAERAFTQAERVDTHNAAKALREGTAAPAPKASRKKLDDATRAVEVAREALAQQKAEFIADIEGRRDDLSAAFALEQDRLQEAALARLDEAEHALSERAHALALQDWLRDPTGRVGKRKVPGERELKVLREVIGAGDSGATYKEQQTRAVDDWNAIVKRATRTLTDADRVPVYDSMLGHNTVPAADEAIEREVERMIEAGEPIPDIPSEKWNKKLRRGKFAPPGAVPGLTPQQKAAAR